MFLRLYMITGGGGGGGGGVIPKSLPVPSTEPALRKAAVDRGLRFLTDQYGCRQRDMTLTPVERRKRKF